MTPKTLVSALTLIALTASSLAFAQRRDERNDDQRPDRGQQQQQQQSSRQAAQRALEQGGRHDDSSRAPDRYRGQNGNYRGQQQRWERGAGPEHSYYPGNRLPQYYRGRQYVVDDWRGHRLSAPPRGYHWVQTGGDYVLVAIATGVILQLLLGN
jgi:Ni/Co efflux regulator RcnB